MFIDFNGRSLDAILALKQCTMNISDGSEANLNKTNESCEEQLTKRRLRSHKNTDENEFILDLGKVMIFSRNQCLNL